MRAVRIRRLRADVALPKYESAAAAGFDLAAADDMTIAPGEVRLVPTGLVIEVPEGMFLGIFARSSTPLKRGLMVANGVGVVDADYCGPADEVKVQVLNFTPSPVTIASGRPHRAGHAAADHARGVGTKWMRSIASRAEDSDRRGRAQGSGYRVKGTRLVQEKGRLRSACGPVLEP